MLNLRFRFLFCNAWREKQKDGFAGQILTILYSSRFVRPQRFTLGEQSEKTKNNDNEQWNLALANKIQRKDCRKL